MKKILLFIIILSIFYVGSVFSFKVGNEKINFSQSIIYQKKSVKITGKTKINIKIIISIGKEKYKIKADKKGKYSFKIHTLYTGKYKVISSIFLKNKYYLVPRVKEISLSKKYVEKMRSYYMKKKERILFNPGVEKYKKKVIFPKVLKKIEKPKTIINFLLLYILLGIMSLLMMFLVLRKNELI